MILVWWQKRREERKNKPKEWCWCSQDKKVRELQGKIEGLQNSHSLALHRSARSCGFPAKRVMKAEWDLKSTKELLSSMTTRYNEAYRLLASSQKQLGEELDVHKKLSLKHDVLVERHSQQTLRMHDVMITSRSNIAQLDAVRKAAGDKLLVAEQAKVESSSSSSVDLLREVVEMFYVPISNCQCFKNPPCSDCVENSGQRELLASIKDHLGEAT